MDAKKEELNLKFIKRQTVTGKNVYVMVMFPHVNLEVSDGDVFDMSGTTVEYE